MKPDRALPLVLLPLVLVAARPAEAADAALTHALEQDAQGQAPGAQRVGTWVEGRPGKTEWSPVLETGKCYFLVGRALGARRLSLYVWGPDGRRVADSRPHATATSLAYCPPFAGPHKVQAKIEGKGEYVLGLFARGAGAAPPPLLPSPAAAPAYAPPVVAAPLPPVVQPVYVAPVAAGPQPGYECRMGSDGINACGYNCVIGSQGHMYCSDFPEGRCALNSDGTFTCPRHPGRTTIIVAPGIVAPAGVHSDKGMRNDPCSNNLDCGFGLFCREDSDGYKMCM